MINTRHKNLAIFIYRILMGLLYPFVRLTSLAWESSSLRERLGFYSESSKEKISVGYNIWLHAASAGEVNAITHFCRVFRKAKPEARIVLTTTSQSGKKIAIEKGVADAVFLAPLDMSRPLKRAFQTFRPVMVLIAETEFWPNLFFRVGHNGIPLLLINGRVSDKSFPIYQRFRALFDPSLNCFGECLVQTKRDMERLAALGVPEKRILVAGQMKYDLSTPDPAEVERFKADLGIRKNDILFTLGSLREGEDDILLPLLPEILRFSPDVKVLVAPRHLKNVAAYQAKLSENSLASVLRSEMEKGKRGGRVVVLDTLGELSLAYALSRAAFVGGTLVPVGGHNVMEPALCLVPVCFGSFTGNVREAAGALAQSGGGFLMNEASELPGIFKRFLDEGYAKAAGLKAFESVTAMRGATERSVQRVLNHWPLKNN